MTQKTENPAGQGGALDRSKCLADTPDYIAFGHEIKDYMRASFLRRRYGLSGARAGLIAGFASGDDCR